MKGNVLHVLIALAIQLCCWFLGFGLWTGATASAFYFIGREYAQAEYRLIEHYYGGKRANMPTLAPLREKRAWDVKSMLDWMLPTIAVVMLAYLQLHY